MKTILLNRFEMAFRSTLAIHISKFIYWFLKDFSSDTVENRLLKQIHAITTKRSGSKPISKFKNTFEVFEFFSLGNLQRIAQNH